MSEQLCDSDSFVLSCVQRTFNQNTTTHALKLFLTGKRELHEVRHHPQSLGSFAIRKTWIGGKESAFKKEKKGTLGTEGSTTAFSMLSV